MQWENHSHYGSKIRKKYRLLHDLDWWTMYQIQSFILQAVNAFRKIYIQSKSKFFFDMVWSRGFCCIRWIRTNLVSWLMTVQKQGLFNHKVRMKGFVESSRNKKFRMSFCSDCCVNLCQQFAKKVQNNVPPIFVAMQRVNHWDTFTSVLQIYRVLT